MMSRDSCFAAILLSDGRVSLLLEEINSRQDCTCLLAKMHISRRATNSTVLLCRPSANSLSPLGMENIKQLTNTSSSFGDFLTRLCLGHPDFLLII